MNGVIDFIYNKRTVYIVSPLITLIAAWIVYRIIKSFVADQKTNVIRFSSFSNVSAQLCLLVGPFWNKRFTSLCERIVSVFGYRYLYL